MSAKTPGVAVDPTEGWGGCRDCGDRIDVNPPAHDDTCWRCLGWTDALSPPAREECGHGAASAGPATGDAMRDPVYPAEGRGECVDCDEVTDLQTQFRDKRAWHCWRCQKRPGPPKDCVHGRRLCEVCQWSHGYPEERLRHA